MTQSISKLLITGGAGFIGSTFVRQCLENEQLTVINLDKLTYASHRLSLTDLSDNPRHIFVEGDIADAALARDLLNAYQPQAIVHLAAETHVDRSIINPATFATTNVVGSCVLLEEVTQYWQQLSGEEQRRFRFLYVSTDEVFGSAEGERVFDEQSALAPNSPYAASKASAGHFVRAFAQTFGLPTIVANPSNNYGPRQHPEKLIPKMILTAARDKPLPLYGDGLHKRDWLHVSDCCHALMAVLLQGKPGNVFTIGGSHCLPNLAVVEMICDYVDEALAGQGQRRQLITHVADRLGHDRRYAVSSDRLMRETEWRPKVPFAEGLRNTVRWYLKHPEWVQQVKESNLS